MHVPFYASPLSISDKRLQVLVEILFLLTARREKSNGLVLEYKIQNSKSSLNGNSQGEKRRQVLSIQHSNIDSQFEKFDWLNRLVDEQGIAWDTFGWRTFGLRWTQIDRRRTARQVTTREIGWALDWALDSVSVCREENRPEQWWTWRRTPWTDCQRYLVEILIDASSYYRRDCRFE